MQKSSVLFLCTGNSCRSQMAEGLCREHYGKLLRPYSAGIEAHGLNTLAVKAMAEIGIDISGHKSQRLQDLAHIDFDYVVTVCGHAADTCPVFPARIRTLHQEFDDPPQLAANSKDEEEALAHYRKVRDDIRSYIDDLPSLLGQ